MPRNHIGGFLIYVDRHPDKLAQRSSYQARNRALLYEPLELQAFLLTKLFKRELARNFWNYSTRMHRFRADRKGTSNQTDALLPPRSWKCITYIRI